MKSSAMRLFGVGMAVVMCGLALTIAAEKKTSTSQALAGAAAKNADKAAAGEPSVKVIQESDLPAGPSKVIKEMTRGGKVDEYTEDTDNGRKYYTASFKGRAGNPVYVVVTEAGDLNTIEETMPADKAPAAALAAARKAAGEKAEVRCDRKTEISYLFRFKKGGKNVQLTLTANGTEIDSSTEE